MISKLFSEARPLSDNEGFIAVMIVFSLIALHTSILFCFYCCSGIRITRKPKRKLTANQKGKQKADDNHSGRLGGGGGGEEQSRGDSSGRGGPGSSRARRAGKRVTFQEFENAEQETDGYFGSHDTGGEAYELKKLKKRE